jgi:hypothetical protein
MTPREASEVLAQYRSGELAPEQRDRFFADLLDNQELYNAFAEQQIFSELFAVAGRTTRAKLAAQKRFLQWPRPRWMWGIGIAFAAVIAVAILVDLPFQRHTAITAPETKQAKTPVGAQQFPPTGGSAQSAGHRSTPEPDSYRGDSTRSQARLEVFGFVLLPTDRGGASQNVLHFGSAAETVRLDIPLDDPFQKYTATLTTAGGERIIRVFQNVKFSGLRSGAKRLTIRVPSNLLPNGDYVLVLSAVGQQGTSESVAGYSFRVVRQH